MAKFGGTTDFQSVAKGHRRRTESPSYNVLDVFSRITTCFECYGYDFCSHSREIAAILTATVVKSLAHGRILRSLGLTIGKAIAP